MALNYSERKKEMEQATTEMATPWPKNLYFKDEEEFKAFLAEHQGKAGIVDYDNALNHLIEAVRTMLKKTVAGHAPVKFYAKDGRRLGFYPPMIALGEAMAMAIEFRVLAGAPDTISVEELEEKKHGLAQRMALIQALSLLSGDWPELEPGRNGVGSGGTGRPSAAQAAFGGTD
jgi:hypothetical protein